MLRIAICDDEPVQLALLEELVWEWAKERHMECATELCENAEQFLFLLAERREKKQEVDILLLDIEMPGMDGVELASRLRKEGEGMQLLFVTGIAERAAEGYDVDAVSFLIKPVKREKLYACLDRAAARLKRQEPSFLLETAGAVERVRIRKIRFLESAGHDTLVHCADRERPVRCLQGIAQLERLLAEQSGAFYRIHRTCVIHLSHVERISRKEVTMEGGTVLPIARGKWEGLNRAYLAWYRAGTEREEE